MNAIHARVGRVVALAAVFAVPLACGPSEPERERESKACARLMGADISMDDDEGDVHFQCVTPILSVESIAGSLEYYVEVLGFAQDWKWGDPPTFASVSRGHVGLFFCERCQGEPGMWMSVLVDDVDRLHAQYADTGALVLRPPRDEPWGMREMIVRDPDGHVLRFGTPVDRQR